MNDTKVNDSMVVGKYADVAGWGLIDIHTAEKAVILQTLKVSIRCLIYFELQTITQLPPLVFWNLKRKSD